MHSVLALLRKMVSIHDTWHLWITKHLRDLLLLRLLLTTVAYTSCTCDNELKVELIKRRLKII
jgi:hypothetical protein